VNVTCGLNYIIIHIIGLEQRITNGLQPTKYILWLTGPRAGMSYPYDDKRDPHEQ